MRQKDDSNDDDGDDDDYNDDEGYTNSDDGKQDDNINSNYDNMFFIIQHTVFTMYFCRFPDPQPIHVWVLHPECLYGDPPVYAAIPDLYEGCRHGHTDWRAP